ncbi:PSD1 and planctomycete cytochrome C domain-containing protein [Aeoliella sp.]|uniref:PSD1 and planctomycete cytochrome C domain-containing protein n=1 Tax=Aeoliella sp. TaxID=2795800 RepID=UPI003CCBA7FD
MQNLTRCWLVVVASAMLAPASSWGRVTFSRDVLPILSDACFQCHGPDEGSREADLRLDQEESVKLDRGDYAAVVPKDLSRSELWNRITTTDDSMQMPPASLHRKLTQQQIETIRQWILEGAEWGNHWAFERVERPKVPVGQHPVDYFVNAQLDELGWKVAPAADKRTLIRRLSLDLTGLPPTPAEVEEFLADERPDAWERLVDRKLASQQFGVRMAWDWLDAARYADTNGYQGDAERTMWPWRDWVVRAFNDNLGFDEFTVWQLAGDLLPEPTSDQVLATAFNRNHMINGEGGRIPEENRVDYVMDMTETMGTVWLGLTLNCCRCHDHKFDPLSQQEYYSLTAFFNQTPVTGDGGNPQTQPVMRLPTPQQQQDLQLVGDSLDEAYEQLSDMESRLWPKAEASGGSSSEVELPDTVKSVMEKPLEKRGKEDWQKLKKHFADSSPEWIEFCNSWQQLRDRRDKIEKGVCRVMVMEDLPEPRPTYVLDRGLYNQPAQEVPAAVPSTLPPLAEGQKPNRLALANWLVSRDQPLTSRVTVNRFWQMFFGVGLVKTVEDFGVQSERPSNGELMDWLAAEFMESGWDTKHLLRIIVTSDAYRRSSYDRSGESYELDPENRYLSRGPRFRLPAWMIRDQALQVSGLLNPQLGGKPVNVYQPPGVWSEATFGNSVHKAGQGDELYRRSLFVYWRRIVGPTVFFDSAKRQVCEVRLARTNTPMHALAVLNDVTYVESARELAENVMKASQDENARLQDLAQRVLARELTPDELAIWKRTLATAQAEYAEHPQQAEKFLALGESKRDDSLPPEEHAAWTSLCLNVLNLDETLTKE